MADHPSDVLMRVRLFADLDPDEIALIAGSMQTRVFPAGSVVTAEGDPGDAFFVIERGEADVMVRGHAQGQLVPGDFFGEVALLMGAERTATITARTELGCLALAAADFAAIVESTPSIALKVLEAFSTREM